ncbi:hypothetical protein GCM10012284_01650 [Mangrovihabitans endophyticus]|uniref:Uncharacterized protein n=1 Tax=Mangrovihabitans endophyticus TaxID=1751298 RepID=A0A8J3BVP1_9ACTN|nr:hypothetical protein GCM10012284_01650 [Mangrovihabitans endophyticus]
MRAELGRGGRTPLQQQPRHAIAGATVRRGGRRHAGPDTHLFFHYDNVTYFAGSLQTADAVIQDTGHRTVPPPSGRRAHAYDP